MQRQRYFIQYAVHDYDRDNMKFDVLTWVEEHLMHQMFECNAPSKGGGHEWYLYRRRVPSEPSLTYVTLQNWPRPNEELES